MNVSQLVTLITQQHAQWISQWKQQRLQADQHMPAVGEQLMQWIAENHWYNYHLWLTEDKARRDDLGHAVIYHAKRLIDTLNQQRNNRVEAIDQCLYQALLPAAVETCPVHSETPGMIIDRLSILALKSYHMGLQAKRRSADAVHRQQCQQKWVLIEQQKQQLAACLESLLHEVQQKSRTFVLYRQFKMYNDPALNPELYSANLRAEDA